MRTRRMVAALAAVVILVATSAQAGLLPLPSVTAKAGANFSNLNTDNLDASARTGFVAGLGLDFSFVAMHLSPEVLLSQKGFKDGGLGGGDQYRTLNLEIPLLFRYGIPSPAVQPSIYVAPAVSFPLKSEAKSDVIMTQKANWVDIKDDTKSAVFSVIIGAGLKFQQMSFDLRYDFGLTNYFDDSTVDSKDRTLTALVGYSFN